VVSNKKNGITKVADLEREARGEKTEGRSERSELYLRKLLQQSAVLKEKSEARGQTFFCTNSYPRLSSLLCQHSGLEREVRKQKREGRPFSVKILIPVCLLSSVSAAILKEKSENRSERADLFCSVKISPPSVFSPLSAQRS
jgi:hypothetical protein